MEIKKILKALFICFILFPFCCKGQTEDKTILRSFVYYKEYESQTMFPKGIYYVLPILKYEYGLEFTANNKFILTKTFSNLDSLNKNFNDHFKKSNRVSRIYGSYLEKNDTLWLQEEFILEDTLSYPAVSVKIFRLNSTHDTLKNIHEEKMIFTGDTVSKKDSIHSLQKSYYAYQSHKRKRITMGNSSSGWDVTNYKHTLDLDKDSSFTWKKCNGVFCVSRYGTWYKYGNTLLLQILDDEFSNGKKKPEDAEIKKIIIETDTILLFMEERLKFYGK